MANLRRKAVAQADAAVAAALLPTLRCYVQSQQRLMVGYSGGLDSTVLLHALATHAGALSYGVEALHVHHGLSAQADHWAAHCQTMCDSLHIQFKVVRVAVDRASGYGLEAAARYARHAAFSESDADWIVLAHHQDDQAETLLFNLLRGAGLAGAAAMKTVNGRLLRPLLGVSRAEIHAYAEAYHLHWIEDASNQELRFTRNYLRHDVLANIAQRHPSATAHLAAAARRFGEALTLLDALAQIDLAEHPADFPLPLAVLKKLPEARARNVLRFLCAQRHIAIPSEARLCELLRQLLTAAADRHPATYFGVWRIYRYRGAVCVDQSIAASDALI